MWQNEGPEGVPIAITCCVRHSLNRKRRTRTCTHKVAGNISGGKTNSRPRGSANNNHMPCTTLLKRHDDGRGQARYSDPAAARAHTRATLRGANRSRY